MIQSISPFKRFLKWWLRLPLPTRIFLGLLLGIPLGILFPHVAREIKPLGDLFLRLIVMIVVPLVFASLFVGTAGLGDIKKLGRIGVKTIAYFLCTTVLALVIGLSLGNWIQPGKGIEESTRKEILKEYHEKAHSKIKLVEERPFEERRSKISELIDSLVNIVPQNPFKALADGNMLQIIFFALLLGIAVSLLPLNKGKPLVLFFDSLSETMVRLVHVIMEFAPLGVLALIAGTISEFGSGILLSLLKYSFVVLLGFLIHMTVVYSSAVHFLAKMNPLEFFRCIRPAQIFAFGTSSSNATLPVTMECAQKNLGVSEEVSSFVLPLGATINMDGTALFQGVATLFIAQVYGMHLGFADQITIVIMATLASIGAAGVPGIGIVTLTMVLQQLNIPLEGIALILGVDRPLDMCRTVLNITGDSSAALIVARSEGELKSE